MDFSATVTNLFKALAHLEEPKSQPSKRPSILPQRQPNILTQLIKPSSSIARNGFLTLHVLFPHDLLPALDLLDRGLVTCLVCTTFSNTTETPAKPGLQQHHHVQEVYYIQSASAVTDSVAGRQQSSTASPYGYIVNPPPAPVTASTGRYRNALRTKATDTYYEVRLDSWNCSCAAFAFNALTLLSLPEEDTTSTIAGAEARPASPSATANQLIPLPEQPTSNDKPPFKFGGMLTRPSAPAPVCKHILAACLASSLPEWAWCAAETSTGEKWRREADVGASAGREVVAGWGAGWGDR